MKKLFVVSISIGVFLIGCEIWLRTVIVVPPGYDRIIHPYIALGGYVPQTSDYPDTESYKTVGYEKRGWLQMPTFPFGKKVNSISERGEFLFRDRIAIAKQQPPSKDLRIFMLGGSTAAGAGAASADARWFIQLEKKLEKTLGRSVFSIPAATPSQVTTQERIIQDLYVIPNHPSAMIFLDGYNDCTTFASAARPGDPNGQGVIYKRFESPFFQLLADLSKYSSLVRLLMIKEIGRIWNVPLEDRLNRMREYTSSVADVYYENIEAMKRRCDLEKIPCFFFLQPARDVTSKNRNPEKDFSLNPNVKCYEEIQSRIKNYPYLHDLSGAFDKIVQNLFSDPAHFNDEGHQIIASEIAKVVVDSKTFQVGIQRE